MFKRTLLALTPVAAGLTWFGTAHANPRPLPFTYPYETLPEGSSELEFHGDVTWLRVDASDPGGSRMWEPGYILQSELEYGLTDHTELGFYQVFKAMPEAGGENTMHFDGFKWRIRHRFAEAGEWPVDVAVYLELETLHDELSLEEKIILGKRFGKLRWMANAWVEQSLERPLDSAIRKMHYIINPTTGFTYQVTPTFHPGVEYWARGEINADGTDSIDRINRTVHHFVGPTAHLNFGKLWWTAGLYANLNNMNTPQVGETYGPLWFRTVLGIDL